MRRIQTMQPATNSKPQRRRRKWLINPTFQFKYAVLIALNVCIVIVCVSAWLLCLLQQQSRTMAQGPAETSMWLSTPVIFLSGAVLSIVTLGGLSMWSILVARRLCGPIRVVSNCLLELSSGRIPTRRPLRQKDEFQEPYDAFWRAIDSVKAGREMELEALKEALRLAELTAAEDEDRERNLASLTQHIEAMCKEAADALGVKFDPARARRETKGSVAFSAN